MKDISPSSSEGLTDLWKWKTLCGYTCSGRLLREGSPPQVPKLPVPEKAARAPACAKPRSLHAAAA